MARLLQIITFYVEAASLYKQVSEWLSLMVFFQTADRKVHVIHIGHVIMTYTLELLSPLTHNLQVKINLRVTTKKETQKSV